MRGSTCCGTPLPRNLSSWRAAYCRPEPSSSSSPFSAAILQKARGISGKKPDCEHFFTKILTFKLRTSSLNIYSHNCQIKIPTLFERFICKKIYYFNVRKRHLNNQGGLSSDKFGYLNTAHLNIVSSTAHSSSRYSIWSSLRFSSICFNKHFICILLFAFKKCGSCLQRLLDYRSTYV